MSAGEQEHDKTGAAGYGCLVAALVGASLGAGTAGLLALRAFFLARAAPLRGPGAAGAYLAGLEWALALVALAAVLVVVAVVAGVVLLKELGDDGEARRRGPVR